MRVGWEFELYSSGFGCGLVLDEAVLVSETITGNKCRL